MASTPRRMVSAIQMKHLGNLNKIAEGLSDQTPQIVVGYVVGKANGIGFRASMDAEKGPSLCVIGAFQGIPTMAGAPVLTGPAFFGPADWVKMVKTALLTGVSAKEIPTIAPAKGKGIDVSGEVEMTVKLEIAIERNNGGGVPYKFVTTDHSAVAAGDPFGELRDFIPAQIAETAKAALPPPVLSANKAPVLSANKAPAKKKRK